MRLLEAEHSVARIGDEVLGWCPASGRTYGQPAPGIFTLPGIEPQPDEGEHAAPVRDAVTVPAGLLEGFLAKPGLDLGNFHN